MTTNTTTKTTNSNTKLHPIELLDNTQKELLQGLIKEKLKQLNHDDDVLLEYTMVLLSNKKVQTTMKEDLKPFLGSSTDRLVDWIWGKMDEIKTGKLNRERERERDRDREKERDRERDRDRERQRVREKERDRDREDREQRETREKEHREKNQKENTDKKNNSGASRLVINAMGSAVKSVQDSKRDRNTQDETRIIPPDSSETHQKPNITRKRDVTRVLERRKSDEEYRRWRESSPNSNNNNNNAEESLKRSRTESENISVANKKAKVYITPEARAKLEIPQEEETESVTFTVTIGQDKTIPLIEDPVSDTLEPSQQIIHKSTRPFPTTRHPYYIKPKPIYVRAPRAVNGRFKNMSLVLQPDKTVNDPKLTTTKINSTVKIEPVETENNNQKPASEKKPALHIPPKKLPQNTPKPKYSASSASVNYLASKLSLDSELPDITITRGGNMVWRSHSHEVKVEK